MRGTRGGLLALAVGLATLALLGQNGGAATTPSALLLDPVGAFSAPTYIASPPGDTSRLVVVEQAGKIQLVLNGVVQATPFLDIHLLVSYDGNERGLFSIAFAPDYATSGLFYVYYTSTVGPGNIQVDEFKRDASDPNIADPSTRRSVLTIPHSTQSNHNGGQLQFGPDDLLYIGTGDGGGGGDPYRAAMNLQDLRGKLLRIDPRQAGGQPYTVPANNPFVGVAGALPEIWSYGLRNPWRFSFDRRHTDDLTIGDVGQYTYEEIDYRPVDTGWGRGVNFGWSCFEGRHVYRTDDPYCNPPDPDIVSPVLEYSHSGRSACSITGGYVVRDQEVPSLLGRYLYSDYCNGAIYSNILQIPDVQGDAPTGLDAGNTTSFGEDSCGHVYVAGQSGEPERLAHPRESAGPQSCIPRYKLPVLTAHVDDDFTISLKDPNGQELDTDVSPKARTSSSWTTTRYSTTST